MTSIGVKVLREVDALGNSGATTSGFGLGKDFSTPRVPNTSTTTFPAFASARVYLPRLKPATGIGTSDVHCETLSGGAPGVELASSCSAIRFPVASNVQVDG